MPLGARFLYQIIVFYHSLNLRFLAVKVTEVLGGPKIILRGIVPLFGPKRRNFDTGP